MIEPLQDARAAPPDATAGGLRILRAADVWNVATAGMSGFMRSSSQEMELRGNDVSFLFADDLVPWLRSGGLRRLLVPWVLLGRVLADRRVGRDFDVIEVAVTSSAPLALAARLAGPRMPACVVLSHGLDERSWSAHLRNMRRHGRKVRISSRVLVPTTLISQVRLGLRHADVVMLVSSEDRDYLLDGRGFSPDRVLCCFGGVSERFFEIPRRSTDTTMRALFLGSWLERKGTIEMAQAWRALAGERPGVRLTVAGVGDGARARADLAGIPGIDVIESVARADLPDLLAQHDVFVLPSWFEGMPLSMLEASAAGLACVMTSVCGHLDMFRPADPESDGGLLVPPGDSDALIAALARLADDVELRSLLGARARERARAFTWARNADRSLAAYRSALAHRVSAR